MMRPRWGYTSPKEIFARSIYKLCIVIEEQHERRGMGFCELGTIFVTIL